MHLFWGKLPSVAYFHIDFSFPFLNLGQSIDVSLSFVKIQDEAGFYLTALIEECNRCSTSQNLTANKGSLNQVRDSVMRLQGICPRPRDQWSGCYLVLAHKILFKKQVNLT